MAKALIAYSTRSDNTEDVTREIAEALFMRVTNQIQLVITNIAQY